MLSLCLLVGQYLDGLTKGTQMQLPTFVMVFVYWCNYS